MISPRYAYSTCAVARLDDAGLVAKAQLEQKIETGEYQTSCAFCFCGNDEFSLLAERDRYGFRNITGNRSVPCINQQRKAAGERKGLFAA